MLPYQSPAICARCGSADVTTTWKVSKKTAQSSVRTFLTMCLGFFVARPVSDSFTVPVCSGCEAKLERLQKTTRGLATFLAILFGLLFGMVYLLKVFRVSDLVGGIMMLVLITLFGALIGAFGGIISGLIIQEALLYDFCSYDGEFFHFENKKFRREFAALNPMLVRLKKK